MRIPPSTCTAAACLPWLMLVACCPLLGCGQQVYEQRLAESARYLAYVDKVDASVGPAWKNSLKAPGPIEQLRVPLQFKEVKPPVPTKNPETGELVEPEIDPRQPDYVAVKLPGLVATWEAPTKVMVDGALQPRKTYLYVLTNAYMFTNAEESRRAPDFVRDLLTLLAEKLSLSPLDPAKDAQREQYPRAQPFYTPQKNYDVYRMADAFVKDGAPYTLELFVHHSGPIDVVLVLAVPVAVDSSERLSERLPYMLESLKASSRPPAAAVKSPAGGASAAPPAPAGF